MDSKDVNVLLYGVNVGFWCIGILFYVIQLTGPLTSLTSILYLYTIFSFGGTVTFSFLLELYKDSKHDGIYQILLFIISNTSVSYYAILVLNTYKVLENNWVYIVCAIPLPMAIAVNLWCLQNTFIIYKIETGINTYALSIVADILVVITQLSINIICYLKFLKFKDIHGFKPLLNQYLSGILFSLLIDIVIRIIAIYLQFNDRTICQICLATAYINLNLEFFLLNRIRMVLMSHIIMQNS